MPTNPDDHGSWTHIKRDDLAALRAENERLRAEIETLRKVIKSAPGYD